MHRRRRKPTRRPRQAPWSCRTLQRRRALRQHPTRRPRPSHPPISRSSPRCRRPCRRRQQWRRQHRQHRPHQRPVARNRRRRKRLITVCLPPRPRPRNWFARRTRPARPAPTPPMMGAKRSDPTCRRTPRRRRSPRAPKAPNRTARPGLGLDRARSALRRPRPLLAPLRARRASRPPRLARPRSATSLSPSLPIITHRVKRSGSMAAPRISRPSVKPCRRCFPKRPPAPRSRASGRPGAPLAPSSRPALNIIFRPCPSKSRSAFAKPRPRARAKSDFSCSLRSSAGSMCGSTSPRAAESAPMWSPIAPTRWSCCCAISGVSNALCSRRDSTPTRTAWNSVCATPTTRASRPRMTGRTDPRPRPKTLSRPRSIYPRGLRDRG